MAVRRWKAAEANKACSRGIAEATGISPFAAHLMYTRGVTTPEQCGMFINPEDIPLIDPMLLPDMDKAVKRISEAVQMYEPIMIYGDYDVDGITSTTLIYKYLSEIGANVKYMLPSRDEDGYGLSLRAIDKINQIGATLILTVDNGISAVEEIEYARSIGIDTVVTDHHKPQSELPVCCALVDAFLAEEEELPFREWAGVGVAFKLASALEGDGESVLERFGDLVALGTVADVVPLIGENRRLTAAGIRCIREHPRLGLVELLKKQRVTASDISSTDIAFRVAPCLNSAGRMGKPGRAVNLLLSIDAKPAGLLAGELCDENLRRGAEQRAIGEAVWQYYREEPERLFDRVAVVAGDNWNPGIVGIYAGRLCELLGKPALLLSCDGDVAHGSARCFGEFSIFKALTECRDLLVTYGGHKSAAGLTVKRENIPELRRRLNEYARQFGDMPVAELMYDCELHPGFITPDMVRGCGILEPFGERNREPAVMLKDVRIDCVTPMGGGMHHKLTVSRDGYAVQLLYFNSDSRYMRYRVGDRIDAIVSLGLEGGRSAEQVKLIVKDIRPTGLDAEGIITDERLYEAAMRGESLSAEQAESIRPDIKQIGDVYRLLCPGGYSGSMDILVSRAAEHGIGCGRLLVALTAMEQVGVIKQKHYNSAVVYSRLPVAEKTAPEQSKIIKRLDGMSVD